MKPYFQQLRESAAKVIEAWCDGNKMVADVMSAKVHAYGDFRGTVEYVVMTYGGRQKVAFVAYELSPLRDEMLVFAQGANVERFSMQPYQIEWGARNAASTREDLALTASKAIEKNVRRMGAAKSTADVDKSAPRVSEKGAPELLIVPIPERGQH
jgi:hypothetical protein